MQVPKHVTAIWQAGRYDVHVQRNAVQRSAHRLLQHIYPLELDLVKLLADDFAERRRP